MPMRRTATLVAATVMLLTAAIPAGAQDGAALYKESCGSCHDVGADRAPTLDTLRTMAPQDSL